MPTAISWSNRLALRNAVSNESGLFVAPITITGTYGFSARSINNDKFWFLINYKLYLNLPSKHDNNWVTIRLSMSLDAVSRLWVIASISSINNMHGEFCY